ncbi:MAG: lipoate--protein ligase [Planctomycetota bacterium]|nr:MAG: lipoate--protein ligase [Planctomycetota bacterium]
MRVRYLDTGEGAPGWNMGLDAALLAGAERRPTLRVYGWREPAVSLGRFQQLARDQAPPALRSLPWVRRPSGGGAVLHRDELTYAIAAPLAALGGGRPRRGALRAAIAAVHAALLEALDRLGIAAELRNGATGRCAAEMAPARGPAGGAQASGGCEPLPAAPRPGAGDEPALCYERARGAAIFAGGRKLIASAQRHAGRALLMHGAIPLGARPNAPAATTVRLAAGRPVSRAELAAALRAAFAARLGWQLVEGELERAEHELVAVLAPPVDPPPQRGGVAAGPSAGQQARGVGCVLD